jgi:hypothetical protein
VILTFFGTILSDERDVKVALQKCGEERLAGGVIGCRCSPATVIKIGIKEPSRRIKTLGAERGLG